MTELRKPWQRQGRSFIRKLNECLGAFPVIKVKVIKVIKDFWLFKRPSTTLNQTNKVKD